MRTRSRVGRAAGSLRRLRDQGVNPFGNPPLSEEESRGKPLNKPQAPLRLRHAPRLRVRGFGRLRSLPVALSPSLNATLTSALN